MVVKSVLFLFCYANGEYRNLVVEGATGLIVTTCCCSSGGRECCVLEEGGGGVVQVDLVESSLTEVETDADPGGSCSI